MPTKKKTTNYSNEIKEAKKIGRDALALGKKLAGEAKAQYDKADSATKKKIKKAALIGVLSLAGIMGAKKIIKKKTKR